MKKVLVTCPPMIQQIGRYKNLFKKLHLEYYAPKVLQTISQKELIHLIKDFDGWIIGDDPASREVLVAGKKSKLRVAIKWGIGTDNVDIDACEDLDIKFSNTPNLFGKEVADLAICYLIGLARDAFLIDREVKKGSWIKPSGISLKDKKLGVVGLGDIGRNIAKRAKAFEMKVYGWDPISINTPKYINHLKSWPVGLIDCDFLVFACALTKNNFHMFDHSTLKYLKKGMKVINISRGGLIKESALIEGLEKGLISSAALDVFEKEPLNQSNKLLTFEKCIFGSHNASNTIEAVDRASIKSINLVSKFLYG